MENGDAENLWPWPEKLEWKFFAPNFNEGDLAEAAAGETELDKGFYDAEFGSLHLGVTVRLDDRFRAKVDDGRIEVEDKVTYEKLEDAKRAACLLGAKILADGIVTLAELAR